MTNIPRLVLILIIASAAAVDVNGIAESDTFASAGWADKLSGRLQREARDLVSAYEKIEKYLESVLSERVKSLMSKIKDIQFKKSYINLFAKSKSDPDSNNARLKKALKLFTSLPKAASLCDFEGYTILAQNRIAIEAKQTDSIIDSDNNKSLKILREYSLNHVESCHDKYAGAFHDLFVVDSSGKLKEAFPTMDQILQGLNSSDCSVDHQPEQQEQGQKRVEDYIQTSHICIKQLMRQLLLAHKHMTGQSVGTQPEVALLGLKKILQEYLVDPCRVYHERYKGVFAPAIYDASIIDELELKFSLPASEQFAAGLQKFKLCTSILKKQEFIQRLMAVNIPRG